MLEGLGALPGPNDHLLRRVLSFGVTGEVPVAVSDQFTTVRLYLSRLQTQTTASVRTLSPTGRYYFRTRIIGTWDLQ